MLVNVTVLCVTLEKQFELNPLIKRAEDLYHSVNILQGVLDNFIQKGEVFTCFYKRQGAGLSAKQKRLPRKLR